MGAQVLQILHEDHELLVVNKPAGLVCHPTREGEMSSLVGRIRLHLGTGEGRLVNRLDRETSGVVLIAKGAGVAGELGRIVARPEGVTKQYWAIVHGHLRDDRGTISAALGRDPGSAVAIRDAVREDGASARTDFVVLRRLHLRGRPFTWLDVVPWTGRKHQIRIHLAHTGHPIVGDKIYGPDEQIYLRFVERAMTDADRETLMTEHHLLHARSLAFSWRARNWQFDAPPDEHWSAWLD